MQRIKIRYANSIAELGVMRLEKMSSTLRLRLPHDHRIAPNDLPLLGVVVGFALFFSVTTASILGFLLPWVMVKIGVDHAPGADPFITTIKDFSGLAVYFLSAVWLLGLTV